MLLEGVCVDARTLQFCTSGEVIHEREKSLLDMQPHTGGVGEVFPAAAIGATAAFLALRSDRAS